MLRPTFRKSTYIFSPLLVGAVLVFSSTTPATSATVYTYTGNPYTFIDDDPVPIGSYDMTMRVTGSFTVNNTLPGGLSLQDISANLLNFSFSDGRNSPLTDANAHADSFEVATDASGALTQWRISITEPFPLSATTIINISTLNVAPFTSKLQNDEARTIACTAVDSKGCSTEDGADDAIAHFVPGTWTVVTPLPTALPLFASGLVGLLLLRWRRKKAAAG
jgi:hypothetical protein